MSHKVLALRTLQGCYRGEQEASPLRKQGFRGVLYVQPFHTRAKAPWLSLPSRRATGVLCPSAGIKFKLAGALPEDDAGPQA